VYHFTLPRNYCIRFCGNSVVRPISILVPHPPLPTLSRCTDPLFNVLFVNLSVPSYCRKRKSGRGWGEGMYHQTEIMKHSSTPSPPIIGLSHPLYIHFRCIWETSWQIQYVSDHYSTTLCVLMNVCECCAVAIGGEVQIRFAPIPLFIPSNRKR